MTKTVAWLYWRASTRVQVLVIFLFKIFMNDIVYFIEICYLPNYADHNTRNIIGSMVDAVQSALWKEPDNDLKWFVKSNTQYAHQSSHPYS